MVRLQEVCERLHSGRMRSSASVSFLCSLSCTPTYKRHREVKSWRETTANRRLKSNSEAERVNEYVNQKQRCHLSKKWCLCRWNGVGRGKQQRDEWESKWRQKKISPFRKVSLWHQDFRFGCIFASPFHHQTSLYSCQCWRPRCNSLNFWVEFCRVLVLPSPYYCLPWVLAKLLFYF